MSLGLVETKIALDRHNEKHPDRPWSANIGDIVHHFCGDCTAELAQVKAEVAEQIEKETAH